jgi:hypothetical protein
MMFIRGLLADVLAQFVAAGFRARRSAFQPPLARSAKARVRCLDAQRHTVIPAFGDTIRDLLQRGMIADGPQQPILGVFNSWPG